MKTVSDESGQPDGGKVRLTIFDLNGYPDIIIFFLFFCIRREKDLLFIPAKPHHRHCLTYTSYRSLLVPIGSVSLKKIMQHPHSPYPQFRG